MTLDPFERVRGGLASLGAAVERDEGAGRFRVGLGGGGGVAVLDVQHPGRDAVVVASATLLTGVSATDLGARALADWPAGADAHKLCFDAADGRLWAQTELLGSHVDAAEIAFALHGLGEALRWAPEAQALAGGTVVGGGGAADGPATPARPQAPASLHTREEAIALVRGMLGPEPVPSPPPGCDFAIPTRRRLLVCGRVSEDGLTLRLAAPLVEDVDLSRPAVAALLVVNRRILFGALRLQTGARTASVEHELLVQRLDPPELAAAIGSLTGVADAFVDSIADTLGGRRQARHEIETVVSNISTAWPLAVHPSALSSYRIVPGETVGGYEIEDEIGSGNFGTVYRAKDPQLPRSVALKVLKPHWVYERAVREYFIREARLAAGVNHPHLVKVHAAGRDGDLVFVAYDLVEGESLGRLLEDAGRLEPARVVALVRQVASALQALHDKRIVHRDIKPGNIMVWRPGSTLETAIILDLGVAHGYESDHATRLTLMAPGTRYYQGPEVMDGVTDDPRLDQYALAATTWELLAGEGFIGSRALSEREIDTRKLRERFVELPGEAGAGPLRGVLCRGLSARPDDRYPTIEFFAEALVGAVAAGGGSARAEAPAVRVGLTSYHEWQPSSTASPAPDPLTAPVEALAPVLAGIVDTEGPIVAERAFRLMLAVSGRKQLSHGIEQRLAAAVRRLVEEGRIEAEREFGSGSLSARDLVLRPAGTPRARPRVLGPRRLDEVPPRELAAVARIAVGAGRVVALDDDVLRAVLAMFGRQRAGRSFAQQLSFALAAYGDEDEPG